MFSERLSEKYKIKVNLFFLICLRNFRKTVLTLVLLAIAGQAHLFAGSLKESFLNPPKSAMPQTLWYWLNGSISREGITKDLEAMKENGIGGAIMFNIGRGVRLGPQVPFMSKQWLDLFLHSVHEADRLGLNMGINNAPGWSSSGGPWIDPEHSMQILTCSRAEIEGGSEHEITLPKPWNTFGWYQDVAVLAYPAGKTMQQANPRITASSPIEGELLMDGCFNTKVDLPQVKKGQKRFVQIEFENPVSAHGLWFRDFQSPLGGGRLQVSSDGKEFRNISHFSFLRPGIVFKGNMIHMAFEPVEGKIFRLVFNRPQGGPCRIGELELLMRPAVKGFLHKAGYRAPSASRGAEHYAWGATRYKGDMISSEKIIDLTDKMDSSGKLKWHAPEGRWTILRIGHTSNGVSPGPIPCGVWEGVGYRPDTPEARPDDGISNSLESDKFSKTATRIHYEAYAGKLAKLCGPLAGEVLKNVHIDSWEVGAQNWTAKLPEEFQQRRGYSLKPYLPLLLTGCVIDSVEKTERFLEDFRRTLQELLLENYFAYFRKLANNDGLELSVEAYHHLFCDTLDVHGVADVPMSEFWVYPWSAEPTTHWYWSAKAAYSGSMVYGSPVVTAEAFTSKAKYNLSPKMLRRRGDLMFAAGVNQFFFHVFEHHPRLDEKPGAMWFAGLYMNRSNTWWKESAEWIDYIKSCQGVLQQGRGIAQVTVLTPRYRPVEWSIVRPKDKEIQKQLPRGFGYLYCSQDGLLNKGTVDNGTLRFELGEGCRMVVLPDTDRASPELLKKFRQLLNAGVSVYATHRPKRAIGMQDSQERNAQVSRVADELWGDVDGKKVTSRRVGKGLLIQGVPLGKALDMADIQPDFTYINADGSSVDKSPSSGNLPPINFLHRRTEETDFYFVANYTEQPQRLVGRFNITGKTPQRWDPLTSEVEKLAAWRCVDGNTEIPLNLRPGGSTFIVFQPEQKPLDNIVSLSVGQRGLFPLEESDDTPCDWRLTAEDNGRLCLQTTMEGTFNAISESGKTFTAEAPELPDSVEVSGPWKVDFEPGLGAPAAAEFPSLISWSEHSNEGIRYFSGHASYHTSFHVPSSLLSSERKIWLDLGRVEVAATVKINGKNLGVLWDSPYVVDVTNILKKGKNELYIRVVNLWRNRLIGDKRMPDAQNIAYCETPMCKAGDKLTPSGLLGPVELRPESKMLLSPNQKKGCN
ncbi:glycosyl hydrolase [Sedimentisphaera salicampi]|uniref:Putative glycosyl hydrolase n=1 Tax=Sedimentisphaera salicampi TaxID=1941349 RepID=A0A1W6LKD0_9BACT|nr:glycosyl hydrolase [Sedimentisphaera salicampi]ARN56184.1 putative glycosyl hydrolase [Sedimentisphaera salicampi]